jgi:hypothetical protein
MPNDQPPLPAPPKPTVANQHEWDMLDDEAKARALFSWSEFWLNRSTPAVGRTEHSQAIVVVTPPTDDAHTTAGWNPAPTPEERESFRDEKWKKY